LSVSGTVASYELSVEGISSTTKVSTVLQLQRLTSGAWNDYGSPWTATANSRYLFTNGTRSVASGYTYRLKVVVTAYTPSGNNSATAYS
jgi:hypothetical protein